MGVNVKKRTASNIYYGKSAVDGSLKHIADVPSGVKCDCVCFGCGKPLEAKKGQVRRHHFAHVSNYECMYASEVALYRAIADIFEQESKIVLPPVKLSFPAWSKSQQIKAATEYRIEQVEFSCAELQYPPDLFLVIAGKKLRIIVDFHHYFEEQDIQKFKKDAKDGGFSILLLGFPGTEEADFFAPVHLKTELISATARKHWIHSELEQRWRERYAREAIEREAWYDGYRCPIHNGFYKGVYSARWVSLFQQSQS